MSLSVRKGNQELKDFVLNGNGYSKKYKRKSRLYPRKVEDTKTVNGKQVVFWSSDYDKRAKSERESAIAKAQDLIGNVQKYNKKNCYGASKYV